MQSACATETVAGAYLRRTNRTLPNGRIWKDVNGELRRDE
jgi:hypothetical protein